MNTVKIDPYDYAIIFNTYEDQNGYYYFNLLNDVHIDDNIDQSLYDEIFYNDEMNWIELSQKYYGTTKLWWIILIANNITDTFNVPIGTRIKILKKNAVTEILNQINFSLN